jgi:hypothetical protein
MRKVLFSDKIAFSAMKKAHPDTAQRTDEVEANLVMDVAKLMVLYVVL